MGKTHESEQQLYAPEDVLSLLLTAVKKQDAPEKKLYTVPEVAAMLQTNTDYVYKLRDAGLLQFILVGRWKVRVETFNDFLAKYEGYDITDPYNVKALTA